MSNFKRNKKLGQNFLKNKKFLKLIANKLNIKPNDIIVEIGGGHGELTQFLINAKRVFVFEIDKKLYKILKQKFQNYKNIKIINKNFLKVNLSVFKNNFKLVGNIPYSITGLIFRKIFNIKNHPQLFILTLQKDVGEKILSKNNFLSHWINIWGKVNKISIIKRNYFYPQPKVDSIILEIKFFNKPLVNYPEKFVKFLKNIFKFPNKKLKNNINLPENFKHLENYRPHQLSFDDILNLYNFYLQRGYNIKT
jgi:16S rRNA (adenine1518-N6/adenine1519-N6)-dimethyltransferase